MHRFAYALAALVAAGLVLLSAADVEAQRRRRRRRRRPRPPGTLTIQTPIEGAEVLIDEESVGYTPLDAPFPLTDGAHTVRVRRSGYTEFASVVQIRRGQSEVLQVDMMALTMVVTVRTTPEDASVFVDGTFRGTTPVELELTEGEHSLRIRAPRHEEAIREITARPGQTSLIDVDLEPLPAETLEPRPIEWYEEPLTWILIGSGVVVATAVVVTVIVVLSQPAPQDEFCSMGVDGRCDADVRIQTRMESPIMGWDF